MYAEFHKAAILGCKILLRPIVKLFLTYGLSYSEFTEVSKFAFLDEAIDDSSDAPNISLTAVRTGISRKAIKKLLKRRDAEQVVLKSDGLYDLRVLELWREDEKYHDAAGNPKSLHYSGDHDVTLSGLINCLGADLPSSTILKRLLSMDLIDIDEEGKYTPRLHNPTPSVVSPDNLVRASLFAAAHIETIANNFSDDAPEKLLERQTFSVKVPRELHSDVLSEIRTTCDQALIEIERIVNSYEIDGSSDSLEMIGIGMYSFNYKVPMKDLSGVFEGLGR